jgi:Double zinc ribbon
MRCPRCGAANPPQARFCAQCGATLTAIADGADGAVTVTAGLVPSHLSVPAGGEGACVVKIRNLGAVVDRVDVVVEGPAATWAKVEPPAVRLLPDAEGSVNLRVRPPRSPDSPAGPLELVVRARSNEHVGTEATVKGVVEVGAYSELEARLVPEHGRGWRRSRHRLILQNGGNTAVPTTISARDPDDLLRFSVEASAVDAAPGAETTVGLEARGRRWHWWGKPRVLPFTVVVAATGASKLSAPGSLNQRALVRLRVALPVLLALPLVIALLPWGSR